MPGAARGPQRVWGFGIRESFWVAVVGFSASAWADSVFTAKRIPCQYCRVRRNESKLSYVKAGTEVDLPVKDILRGLCAKLNY